MIEQHVNITVPSGGERAGGARPAVPDTARQAPSRKVLVVDDQPLVRRVVKRFLERTGYEVTTSNGGASALALIRSEGAGFDLLLTDLRMRGINGDDLAEEALRIRPELKVLCMSGNPRGSMSGDDLEHPILLKPFGSAELYGKVEAVLEAAPTDAGSPA